MPQAEAKPDEKPDKQLGEVLIEGLKPEKDPQKVIDWMARLVGEFSFEGEVDLGPRAGRRTCTRYVARQLHRLWPRAGRAVRDRCALDPGAV